jgi:hypothetical protein
VERWKKAKPIQYPSFDAWKEAASHCDDAAHLLPDLREARTSAKLVAPERLAEAVSRWIDWEAFAYWARPALEFKSRIPTGVAGELGRRCPGFLEAIGSVEGERPVSTSPDWHGLMSWIADHCFQVTKAEGWFDAVLIQARSHPRAIRTMEYADHCDGVWSSQMPEPYPSFEDWRKDADSYIDLDD